LFGNTLTDCGDLIELSTEYTTAELIADTVAALPAYSGAFNPGPCNSERNLLPDEHQYLVTRLQYVFAFDPAPSDCTITWRERTRDADGNCVGDVFKSTTVHAGDTQSDVFELLEPDANGIKEIVGNCCEDDGTCLVTTRGVCNTGIGGFAGTWLADSCDNPCDASDCADA
jgi:hypothetical protein